MRRINQYFDGKRTDDEILYRAEMSRKELREVLHHYDEYVSFLPLRISIGSESQAASHLPTSLVRREGVDVRQSIARGAVILLLFRHEKANVDIEGHIA